MGTYLKVALKDKTEDHIKQVNQELEPEGKKQALHFTRPITISLLEEFFWNEIGKCVLKLSGSNTKEVEKALIIAKWVRNNPSLINKKESNYYDVRIVNSYIK